MRAFACRGTAHMNIHVCKRIAIAAVLLLPGAAFAKAVGSIAVEKIETRVNGGGREVVIHTSKEPTFSVFRLSDPFRVLVDVNDARTGGVKELEKVNDGVLRYVSTNTFADETSAIVRVEIALNASAEYRVRADGASIVVSIDGAKAAPLVEQPKAEERTEEQAQPAAVSATPASIKLGTVSKHKAKGRTVLSARLESGQLTKDAVAIEQLADPPRLVVHVAGASIDPKWQRVDVDRFGVKRARVGSGDDGVRFVLDLEKAESLPQIDVDAKNGNIEVALSAPSKKAHIEEIKIEEPEHAEAEQPAVETKEEPAPAPVKESVAQVHVKDVTFEPRDGFVRLTVQLDSESANVEKVGASREDAPMLRIANADLPKLLERMLDTSEVAGEVIQSVSTYKEGNDTILAASIGPGTEHRFWKKGSKLMWDFRASTQRASANEAPARVINYGEQATSGFASTAVQIPGTIAPEAARYKGRRISLDFKDAEIQNVLRLLADVSKLNIVAAEDVKGRVTIKLRNVPWDQALDIILRAKGLDKTRNGNIIRVAPVE